MKKIISFIIASFFLVVLFSSHLNLKESNAVIKKNLGGTTTKERDVREIAFNQLTSEDRDRIIGAWENSKLSKIILKEGMGNINDKSYIGKEVYVIDFLTTSKSLPNNIIVYIGMDNYNLIGYGYLD